ncbi:MAG: hypothetical protein UU65_C0001G0255 [candidate division CPR2 bacterium GW2011_GWC1_41_48]|uniref:Uncharacterized protein n=1 Tax=candidate division CPR2 bacterium GW2011_GWC1_41_48 TaxID=1618344 RepID=A0A0G0WA47_UNCC2|nr:MAG: hypothetical protein UT47_C0001G0255 [candidate division CPR2 bacterium GW2011_GWC2_39_35]KKR28398.1 MAG: hypothetical protein UT60_C0021G0002 [candidate division CPR2 bacterium GW2011_GWD2_39_7]KKS09850.1 MAG: hypothetical protein UU65_C0001G0255 [candidate division CPR2 bacterium GW2011_GWC1_41_48]OGB72580.1 MAG: hypothetical protein A2Y26_03200 [candidate division CPR2 bacterium GWD2_39_7]
MSLELIVSIFQGIFSVLVFVFTYTWWIIAAILAWETYQNYRKKGWVENLEHMLLKVEIPKNNDKGPVAAEMMFASLHGILKDKTEQQKEGSIQEHISFEIVATLNSIQFYIWVPVHLRDYLEGQLYAQYPSAEITVVDDYSTDIDIDDDGIDDCVASTELVLEKEDLLPIKTFQSFEVDPLAGITSVLSKLDDPKEQVWIQILAKPHDNSWQTRAQEYTDSTRTGGSGGLSIASIMGSIKRAPISLPKTLISMALRAPEPAAPTTAPKLSKHEEAELTAIDTKANKLGYDVKIRIMYLAKTKEKAKYRLQAVVGSFKQFNTTLNGFTSTGLNEGRGPLDEYRARYFDAGYLLNIEELASIYHLPHISVETPNINWVSSKKAEPPATLPVEGSAPPDELTLFAQTNFRGVRQKFGIKMDDRRRHTYVIGKSGVGKSWLLALLSISDIYAGKGVCIIDPHGDLAEKVITYVPEHRIKDVVYFNPSDTNFPIGFNTMECPNPDFKETIASGFVSIFKKQFGYSWGPRLEYVLRYTILALLDTPETTMLGVIRMLTEKNFRQKVIKNIKDPVVKNFWEKEYATYNDRFATEAVAPILNKVGQFIASPLIRNIVGQPISTFDIREIMDEEKILIINLSSGRIGEDNSALLGAMMITKIQLAAMSRADVSEEKRKDFYLYVDEFQNFATDSFAKILSEARKYRLNLIVANQYIAQMDETVRDAVFGNVGTLVSYRVGAKDATFLENEFSGIFESHDLINLDNQHIYLKMLIDGVTRQPFSGKILNLPEAKLDLTTQILQNSREQYTKPKTEVEEMIAKLSTQGGQPQNEDGEDIREERKDNRYDNRPNYNNSNNPKRDFTPPAVSAENRIKNAPLNRQTPRDRVEPGHSDKYIARSNQEKPPMKQPVKHSSNSYVKTDHANNIHHDKRPMGQKNPSDRSSNDQRNQKKLDEENIRKAIREALSKKEQTSNHENRQTEVKVKPAHEHKQTTEDKPKHESQNNNNKVITHENFKDINVIHPHEKIIVAGNNVKNPKELNPGETIVFNDK